jgi:diketogulonate reductase-like aldo/keto reductase
MMTRLGLGTWHMGEDASRRAAEVAALRLGLDLGMKVVDTAEMYGDGGAERVVGEAIRGRRHDVFVVTKFYPHHAARAALAKACDGSLSRLAIDAIDLYLLHWPGSVPLEETVEALERLVDAGKIRRWGVSNFDVAELEALVRVPAGDRVAADQVLYNLPRRGIEYDLLEWCSARSVAVMAYSPLDEGALGAHPALRPLARRLDCTPAQLALAWVLRKPGVVAIPKASNPVHVRANAHALELALDPGILALLDRAFPPPSGKRPLEVI